MYFFMAMKVKLKFNFKKNYSIHEFNEAYI